MNKLDRFLQERLKYSLKRLEKANKKLDDWYIKLNIINY